MGRKAGSKKGGSKTLEAPPTADANTDEKEVSPAKRRRMGSDAASPSATEAAASLAAVADAAHLLAGVANSVNSSRRGSLSSVNTSRRGSLAVVSLTVEDTEAENNARVGFTDALGNTLSNESIPDISLAARKSFADILQGLQGSDMTSIHNIAAQAAQALQQVHENEATARKSVDASGSLASMTAAAAAAAAAVIQNSSLMGGNDAGGGSKGGSVSSAAGEAAAVIAAQMLQTQMMQASDMASITAQANAAAAQVAGNGSASGPRRGRRSNPGPISGFAQTAISMRAAELAAAGAAGAPTTPGAMFGGHGQTLMSSILQQSTPASATPATPVTGVFSPAMAKAQLAANTAHAQSAVSEQIKKQDRLEKNRKAAKQCRLKKKEYQRCLEERVQLLEARQAELMEELLSISSEMSPSALAALQHRIREKYQQPIAAMPQAPPDTPHIISTPRATKPPVIGIPGTAILTSHAVSPTATGLPMASLQIPVALLRNA